MKRLLALLLACLLLTLTACGTQAEDIVTVEPSELTAEDLPESCRRWFDIAASSGTAEPDSQLPLRKRATTAPARSTAYICRMEAIPI